jgi:nucleoside-diphosphate-sugar epimerase
VAGGGAVKALITGDRGFLGRHFVEELRRRGWDVVGCDVKTTRAQDCRRLFAEDVRLRTLPHWDLVVHCAAVVGGRATIDGDPLATAESLSIDAEMFRWAAVARPGRVLYFSSSAAYPVSLQHGPPPRQKRVLSAGQAFTDPTRAYALREDAVWSDCECDPDPRLSPPDQVYGWSKVTGELLAARLRDAGVPVTVIRPFSGYGEDQDETYPFRAILGRVRRREDPLTVWGTGEQVRDWIHVDDLVAGALAVAESGTEDPVNLCTGLATSFLELAEMMARAAGYEPVVKPLADKPAGVAYRVGDPSRMLRFYEPRVPLEDGIRRALGVAQPPEGWFN